MKVDAVDIFRVEVPLLRTFRSSEASVHHVCHILVRVRAGAAAGWGEAPTPVDPFHVGETPDSAWMVIERYLAPMLLSLDWEDPREVAHALVTVKGNPFARAAVEAAAWDLWSGERGISLSDALADIAGVEATSEVPAGATVGMEETIGILIDRVEKCVESGYARVKIKIAPGADVPVLSIVRQEFPDLAIVADANGAYRIDDPAHLTALTELDTLGLLAIEQPMADDDLEGHRRLQAMVGTRIALDEAITSPGVVASAVALGACRAVSVKASRLGGITTALDTLRAARFGSLDAWCGGVLDLGIGRAANVALASLEGFTLPGDMAGSDFYFENDLIEPRFDVRCASIPVPSGPGIGVEVDEAGVERCATRSMSVR